MHYLQAEFPPSCGAYCPGCRVCCDVVFCKRIPTGDSKSNSVNSSAKRLIQALEDVKKRTEFLQKKLSSFERISIGIQVDKISPLPLKASNSNLANTITLSSESTIQRYPKFDDKSISTEDEKSLTDTNDSKEIMNLCLLMMKEIREVRDNLKHSCKRFCEHCQGRCLNSQQMDASTTNCAKCKKCLIK
ncbi:uncharacterized protein LOC122512454 [Leptopilina heterotoma]|uniref:uncharacterized protein LOC122512454 n=1 Tax=Leptopilina heterotoma TaxID=63436 RepID=UPI001CA96CC0|nr:uncharacterized protein LOC122512454 [Leptopilina heterotoma]